MAGAASVVVDVPFGVAATLAWPGGAVSLEPGRSAHEVALSPV